MIFIKQPSISTSKRLGKYYTPPEATELLCKWSVISPSDHILEPSFGGCGFLKSATARLKDLGCSTPEKQLFGCDIDTSAFNHLARELPLAPASNFIKRDFLEVQPNDFNRKFDVIIGNPPWVSSQNLSKRQSKSLQQFRLRSSAVLHSDANLWAYFVLHSVQFLKPGGRAAWVLPHGLLQTHYGRQFQREVASRFSKACAIGITERLFAEKGVNDPCVVLLLENHLRKPKDGGLLIRFADSTRQFGSVIGDWAKSTSSDGVISQSNPRFDLLTKEEQSTLADLPLRTLGSISTIRIGMVTGANDFFIFDKRERSEAPKLPPRFLVPVVANSRQIPGIRLRTKAENARLGVILDSTLTGATGNRLVQNYLRRFPIGLRDKNVTFSKRPKWHNANDHIVSDAFFVYMGASSPRIVLNESKIPCTNSVYRLDFNRDIGKEGRLAAALSMLSTPSQLSSELSGRIYGGGLIKHEPSDAAAIMITTEPPPKSPLKKAFAKAHELLLSGKGDAAREIADSTLFPELKGKIRRLGIALDRLRAHRKGEAK